jgi:hypothetical protein
MPYTWAPFQRRDQISLSEIPSTDEEVREETFAQAFEENPIELFLRYNTRRQLETGLDLFGRRHKGVVTQLSADQANTMAKEAGLPLSYKTRTSKEAVELDIERKRTELRRQEIFARSQGGVALGAQRLAIAIGTTLADPVSAALNFVPVVGQTRYAKWLGGATRLGRVGIRAGVGAAEGLAGAAIYEPILYSAKRAEQADYDAGDSLLNLSLGTLLGAGIHTVGGSAADGYRALRQLPDPYRKTTPGIQAAINAGRIEAPTITRTDIEAGGARLDTKLDEAAEVAIAPAVPVRPEVKLSVVDREFRVTSANGETVAYQRGNILQITDARTAEVAQKTGEGTARIQALIDEAERRGLNFTSDTKVSTSAAKVYDRLERQGYTVKRNTFDTDADGNLVSDSGRPVFEVTGLPQRNAAERAAAATPQQRETALRTAVIQRANGEDVNVSNAYGDSPVAKEQTDTTIERSAEADEQVREGDATDQESLDALTEEATVERQLADDQAKQLGIKDDALVLSDKAVAKIERWANAAELAHVCLVRGG